MLPPKNSISSCAAHEEIGHRLSEGVDPVGLFRALARTGGTGAGRRRRSGLSLASAGNRRTRENRSPTRDRRRHARAGQRGIAGAEDPAGRERRHDLRLALLPRDSADEKSAILEIRAGTGGDEAALFAGDLFRMYQRYAGARGWAHGAGFGQRGNGGRLQGNHRPGARQGRVRAAEIRKRRRIACSAFPPPKRRAASTPRPQPSRCCRRPGKSTCAIDDG